MSHEVVTVNKGKFDMFSLSLFKFDFVTDVITQSRSATRILLRKGLESGKFLYGDFDDYFRCRNLYDVIKMTAYATF